MTNSVTDSYVVKHMEDIFNDLAKLGIYLTIDQTQYLVDRFRGSPAYKILYKEVENIRYGNE